MTKRKRKTVQDPRLGVGSTWPEQSISGQSYDRTQSTVRFDDTYFVVLDRFIDNATRDALLDELRNLITPSKDDAPDEPA